MNHPTCYEAMAYWMIFYFIPFLRMKRWDTKEKNFRNYDVSFLTEMVYDVHVRGQEQLRNEICLCEK
ncbi:TPA: hypothetical protein ROY26_003910 [Bacillus anthracis]|nr:hypothetical protein [Bacillus anthracis]